MERYAADPCVYSRFCVSSSGFGESYGLARRIGAGVTRCDSIQGVVGSVCSAVRRFRFAGICTELPEH